MEIRKEKDINLITDLTLGLVDTLTSLSGVKDVSVGLRPASEKANLASWEQRHGVALPQALKQLYLTTDGFSLTWNFTVAGKTLPLGNLELHSLSRLCRVSSGRSSGDPLNPSLANIAMAEEVTSPQPVELFSPSDTSSLPRRKSRGWLPPTFHVSKLFEIDNCKGNGRVVLAYPGRGETFPEATFWFVDLSLRFHYLASDATSYWRLLLVNLGMPQWQALAVGLGLTPWARQWYEILTPHILEGSYRQYRPSQPELINKLDWSVFKVKRGTKSKTNVKETTKAGKDSTVEKSVKEKDRNKAAANNKSFL